MSEIRPTPTPGDGPQGPSAERRTPPGPPPPADTPPAAGPPPQLQDITLLEPGIESTDDSPTIISRRGPRPSAPPEEAVSGGLRGRRLAHFELIEPIGVGGMAAVLRARDTQLDRFVALKILPPEMAQDGENVRRFHQEARSAAKLDHENIARVFFCGEDQRLHFIAFEFVEGENLRTVLERRGRLPVGEALHYMVQVAAGLAHAARRGVVHRDIKPSNIIITPNGRAKLVDMGLARSMEPTSDNGLTQSGVTLGTFDYISPEQALEPRDADVRSDIYSLGCTFYHMLTGRPPVPEGTAAKKLHCHQHVRPPDPRQFVPDLPDEVAVVLDRMMAKQPRDRYQSPEQLVHHLLLVARKQGASPEVPEGVLSVEAALPQPPGSRPLALAALAAAAVVALIFLLGQSPPANHAHPGRPQGPENQENTGQSTQVRGKDVTPPVGPPPSVDNQGGRTERVPVVARYESENPTARELAEWLRQHQNAREIEVVLGGDLELGKNTEGGAEQGLVLKASRKVTVRAKDPAKRRPMIRFTYPNVGDARDWTALTIVSDQAVVKDVRVLVDATRAPVAVTALRLQLGGPDSEVRRCEFIQAQPAYDEKDRVASVVLEATRGQPNVKMEGCSFLGYRELTADAGMVGRVVSEEVLKGVDGGGQDAVVWSGPVSLTAENCVFGPHAAAFRVVGGQAGAAVPRTTVKNCSVLAGPRSSVFQVAGQAPAHLVVESSLFARAGELDAGTMMDQGGAVLIRQDGDGKVTYTGKENRYYLDGYWLTGDDWTKAGWRDFVTENGRNDASARKLAAPPWQDPAPLKQLEAQKLALAFAVKTRVRELRVSGAGGKEKDAAVVGVQRLEGDLYPKTLPAVEDRGPAEVVTRTRVVVPGEENSSEGVYPSLEAAVVDARPGDLILIKTNKVLRVPPILLAKGKTDLTIRPAPNCRPVLTFAEDTPDADAALFQLQNGKLHLEGLEFLLRPGKDFKGQAVVLLAGNGECSFKNCLVTLDRGGRKTALAVAVLPPAGKDTMTMETTSARSAEQGPRLSLQRCFVRGEGDLVRSRASRPFELEAQNTLAALTGSFLDVEVRPDAAAAPQGLKVPVRLRRVTAYLGGQLIRVSAEKGLDGLVPVQCDPADCLFVPSAEGQALIHVDAPPGVDVMKTLKDKLVWKAGRNAYGKFDPMLDQQTAGEDQPAATLDAKKWQEFTGESDNPVGAKLAEAPSSPGGLTRAVPSQFKPDPSQFKPDEDFGADTSGLPGRRLAEPK